MDAAEERVVLLAARDGDRRAQGRLMEKHYPMCFRVAARQTRRQDIYMDVVQEGVFGIVTAIPKFEMDSGYRFITYAYWWILDFAKHAREVETKYDRHYEGDLDPMVTEPEVQDSGHDQEEHLIDEMLIAANGKVSPLDKRILRRYYKDQWTDRQIAEAIGTTTEWVRLMRRKALNHLKELHLAVF